MGRSSGTLRALSVFSLTSETDLQQPQLDGQRSLIFCKAPLESEPLMAAAMKPDLPQSAAGEGKEIHGTGMGTDSRMERMSEEDCGGSPRYSFQEMRCKALRAPRDSAMDSCSPCLRSQQGPGGDTHTLLHSPAERECKGTGTNGRLEVGGGIQDVFSLTAAGHAAVRLRCGPEALQLMKR
ncbi:hypothetical protein NQZ68_025103 [Dissostichus eleginoides]|nr:hypothetical protein NQZ68_025103 [Dissostichus eleginoides]